MDMMGTLSSRLLMFLLNYYCELYAVEARYLVVYLPGDWVYLYCRAISLSGTWPSPSTSPGWLTGWRSRCSSPAERWTEPSSCSPPVQPCSQTSGRGLSVNSLELRVVPERGVLPPLQPHDSNLTLHPVYLVYLQDTGLQSISSTSSFLVSSLRHQPWSTVYLINLQFTG